MNENILVYPINFKSRKEVIKIKPIMDLHKGSKTCDLKAFKKYISEFDELTYFFTNGDLWDAIYFRDKRFKASGQENTDLDDPIDVEIDEMVDLLSPIKDRLICIGHGNHEETVLKSCHVNMSKRLSKALDIPYLGYSFWIRLKMDCHGKRVPVDIFATHGFGGGGRTEGGSITKYSKFADRYDCDIFVVGHDHKLDAHKYPSFKIVGDSQVKLYSKSKQIVLGGSWKKAYSNDTSTTWEETKGFPPNMIGGATVEIKIKDPHVEIKVQT